MQTIILPIIKLDTQPLLTAGQENKDESSTTAAAVPKQEEGTEEGVDDETLLNQVDHVDETGLWKVMGGMYDVYDKNCS